MAKQLGSARLTCRQESSARKHVGLTRQGCEHLNMEKTKVFTWIAEMKLSVGRQLKDSKCWKLAEILSVGNAEIF